MVERLNSNPEIKGLNLDCENEILKDNCSYHSIFPKISCWLVTPKSCEVDVEAICGTKMEELNL